MQFCKHRNENVNLAMFLLTLIATLAELECYHLTWHLGVLIVARRSLIQVEMDKIANFSGFRFVSLFGFDVLVSSVMICET